MKDYTVEEIRVKLCIDDNWLYRGLVAIFERQTAEEQAIESTVEHNGIGFNGADAEILSSFAKQVQQYGKLTEKQRIVARKRMLKYSRQLWSIAQSKKEGGENEQQ